MRIIRTYISQILQDIHGEYSSKRIVMFLCVILMAVAFIANLFWSFTIDEFMFEAIMYIVIAGMGFSGAEYFAPRKKDDDTK